MNKKLFVDLCIVGAGAGGLSVAAVATQLGLSVVIIEHDKMGGDCLNYGCIPSKSLLAAAHVANTFRNAETFGIKNFEPEIDFTKVMAHVHKVIAAIAPNDSVERFEKLGGTVILANAKFVNEKQIVADDYEITARYFILAAGSSPFIPPISGLDKAPYFTNETIFSLTEKPKHLIIIGGGPIGCELAQAFLLLGIPVNVIEAQKILPHDDAEIVAILRKKLVAQGLQLYEDAQITSVANAGNQVDVFCEINGSKKTISGSHLLIATGRRANVEKLNLAAAKVRHSANGVEVNDYLRTSNPKIYAIGDITGGYQFTHVANYHAGIVIRNLLFRIPTKVNYRTLPWVTYTEPELAHVGLTAKTAQEAKNVKTISWPFAENDRAQTAHETLGQIKVFTNKKAEILGVSILGAQAGELLTPWILAMQNKMKLKNFTNIIIPYPTLSEINKAVANNFYRDVLFSKFTKRLINFLKKF